MIRRALIVLLIAIVPAVSTVGAQAPSQTEQQKKFIPLSEAPQQEQIPSARLVITAYAFVVLALFVYLVSISKRLSGVKQELARLENETKRSRRA